MSDLASLVNRYFAADVGTGGAFDDDSEVTPIIDGADYFSQIAASIDATSGPDDLIYVLTWELETDWDLHADSGPFRPLGELLAKKAAAGVDVRVVLNGHLYYSELQPLLKVFANNFSSARRLRSLTLPGSSDQPLRNRVLFDWSGASLTGSHHQKSVIVARGSDAIAYVGGMSMIPLHQDKAPHNKKQYTDAEHTPWGWHDIGLSLKGPAMAGIMQNFNARWIEAASLPDRRKWDFDVTYQAGQWRARVVPKLVVNPPQSNLPAAMGWTLPPALPDTGCGVRVLRSRFEVRLPGGLATQATPWTTPPIDRALTEVFDTYRVAIAAARRYIYIEDQFLDDQLYLEHEQTDYSLYGALGSAMANQPGLKVILVGSGRGDPDDLRLRPDGRKNLALSQSVKQKLLGNVPVELGGNLAVWRLENATVHSKLLMIDDEFLSIGSSNFQARSFAGIDAELQIATVSPGDLVRDFRVKLWSEHLRLSIPPPQAVAAALLDLDSALGVWRPGWYAGDAGMWSPDNPAGFVDHGALAFVGPSPVTVPQ